MPEFKLALVNILPHLQFEARWTRVAIDGAVDVPVSVSISGHCESVIPRLCRRQESHDEKLLLHDLLCGKCRVRSHSPRQTGSASSSYGRAWHRRTRQSTTVPCTHSSCTPKAFCMSREKYLYRRGRLQRVHSVDDLIHSQSFGRIFPSN